MGSRLLLGFSAAEVRPFLAGARLFLTGALPRRRSLRHGRDLSACSGLQPPDLPRLAEAARISLTPEEVEEFAPKINQVIDWFGQLQGVDLESVEPALRADTEIGDRSRPDTPETFDNRQAILAAVPSYDEPYIKVPKVLNKE